MLSNCFPEYLHQFTYILANGNPLKYSCLENPIDGGAWWATYSLWGRKESNTTERLHSLANK